MKAFNFIVGTVFVGVVGFVAYTILNDSKVKYYVTVKPEYSTIEETMTLPGYVYPSREIEIKPQLSGVIDEIFVKVGDRVQTGAPLASVSLVPNSSEIEQLQSNVTISKINLDAVTSKYEKVKQLYEKNAISRLDYESTERDYLTTQENYKTAVRQLNIRKNDLSGQINSANIVKASTSGIVIDIPVEIGSSVTERSSYQAGSTIATLAGEDFFVFKADVPEHQISSLSVGMPVVLRLLPYDTLSIDAVIVKISAKAVNSNGGVRFPIEAEFTLPANNGIEIRSGYSADARICLHKVEDVLSLPEKYLKFKGDSVLAYVTDSTKKMVREKLLTLGLSDGEKVEIINGIRESDLIVANYDD